MTHRPAMRTIWLIWLCLIGLTFVGLELGGYYVVGLPGTLSDSLRAWGQAYPVSIWLFGFGTGLLVYHLYGRRR